MNALRTAFREYGFSRYTIKEAAVATGAVRRAFDAWACARAIGAQGAGSSFNQAQHVCQAVRLLEAHGTSALLARLHATVLRKAGAANQDKAAARNEIRSSYLSLPIARKDRWRYLQHGPDYAVRMKFPRSPEDPRRQGNLVVLKAHDPVRGERGVLYLQYTESIRPFVALFDLTSLAENYRLVVEPSTWGYQDESFLLLIQKGFDVLVQAQDELDFDYVCALQSNLIALPLGAGDWIDPQNFVPLAHEPKKYDFVMVASWSPVKRHAVLFDALAKGHLQRARIALIGYPWEGRTRRDIEKMAARAGLHHVDIFERIPRAEVAAVIRQSRIGVMLTRREGANRGIYECLFCGIPIVVPSNNRGVNKALINAMTGKLASDAELPQVLAEMLDSANHFRPREWATSHTGYRHAWTALNSRLAGLAQLQNETYDLDIAMTRSAPAAAYVLDADAARLDAEHEQLKRFLRTGI